jgi:hypothetical protein
MNPLFCKDHQIEQFLGKISESTALELDFQLGNIVDAKNIQWNIRQNTT